MRARHSGEPTRVGEDGARRRSGRGAWGAGDTTTGAGAGARSGVIVTHCAFSFSYINEQAILATSAWSFGAPHHQQQEIEQAGVVRHFEMHGESTPGQRIDAGEVEDFMSPRSTITFASHRARAGGEVLATGLLVERVDETASVAHLATGRGAVGTAMVASHLAAMLDVIRLRERLVRALATGPTGMTAIMRRGAARGQIPRFNKFGLANRASPIRLITSQVLCPVICSDAATTKKQSGKIFTGVFSAVAFAGLARGRQARLVRVVTAVCLDWSYCLRRAPKAFRPKT